ncbi:hypothetical protein [uncultured Piscinibacter sp.]|uniref:hypothetical protein n=1 Tax=uncultured Piscinibacter sp. TaxID=1131835 RepID=UPI002622AA28|nr:hypothetical protein [uncultured Piscinibacter sp.]
MVWKDLGTKDRWLLVTAGLQAAATIGTFLVAVVGIWKVTPIITYQVQQQEAEAKRAAPAVTGESVTDRFAADAVNWWGAQVASHQRILDLTGPNAPRDRKVTFEVIAGGSTAVAPGVAADLLVVTSTAKTGSAETVRVPVNEHAMPPSQYLQLRVNHGALAGLDEANRAKAEIAVMSYIQRQMVPRVLPAHVQQGMSLKQLHDEIALEQGQRVEALQHLIGLKDMLDGAMRN